MKFWTAMLRNTGKEFWPSPRAKGFNRLAYILPWLALVLGAWLLVILLKKLRAPVPASAAGRRRCPIRVMRRQLKKK